MDSTNNKFEDLGDTPNILVSDIGKANSLFETIINEIKQDAENYIQIVNKEKEENKRMKIASQFGYEVINKEDTEKKLEEEWTEFS
ncbi:MAG: hypothetical protein MJ252_20580 [archaeon]|nr:hypothetical protein [archaeon]